MSVHRSPGEHLISSNDEFEWPNLWPRNYSSFDKLHLLVAYQFKGSRLKCRLLTMGFERFDFYIQHAIAVCSFCCLVEKNV